MLNGLPTFYHTKSGILDPILTPFQVLLHSGSTTEDFSIHSPMTNFFARVFHSSHPPSLGLLKALKVI